MGSTIWDPMGSSLVVLGDNLDVLAQLPDEAVPLVYIDPPFNTGRRQKRRTLRTTRDRSGDRIGFKGAAYRTIQESALAYDDIFEDYWGFLEPRLAEAWRVLAPDGS